MLTQTILGADDRELVQQAAHGLSCTFLMHSHTTSGAVSLTSTTQEIINLPLELLPCCASLSLSFTVCKLVINYVLRTSGRLNEVVHVKCLA